MGLVGPGATPQVATDARSLLDGANEYEYVEVLNPLTDDFAVQVAQDIAVNAPFNIGRDPSGKTSQMTNTEQDVRQIYGLGLKNPDFQAKKHISNSVIIKSGQTLRLKGSEAQVAVRQIVNELMQREGNARLLSDPTLRREAEERVVQGRGTIQELMGATSFVSPQQQATEAINRSNEVHDEPTVEFPDLDSQEDPGIGEASRSTEGNNSAPEKRSPGRPKKAEQSTV